MRHAIAVNASGSAYVAGTTRASDFPATPGAYQATFRGGSDNLASDAFVAKINAAGTAFDYVTYLGGSGNDEGTAIAVDEKGGAWITGRTESANFPTVRAAQPAFGDGLVFSSANAGATWTVAAGGVTHRNVSAVASIRRMRRSSMRPRSGVSSRARTAGTRGAPQQ
jgi:hypothetical protein